MSIRFLLIQGIGFWGTILFFLSYQFRSNKSLFRVQFFFLSVLYGTSVTVRGSYRWDKLYTEYRAFILPGKQK